MALLDSVIMLPMVQSNTTTEAIRVKCDVKESNAKQTFPSASHTAQCEHRLNPTHRLTCQIHPAIKPHRNIPVALIQIYQLFTFLFSPETINSKITKNIFSVTI